MKPAPLALPARDLGLPSVKPLALKLIERLEAQERRLAKLERTSAKPVSLSAERLLADRLEGHAGHTAVMERERVIHRALDEEYFRREISAGRAVYEGAVTEVLVGNAYAMRFPAGASTAAGIQVESRDLWPRTRPRLHVWYTSAVGSTATFTIRFVIRFFPVGAPVTGTFLVVDFTPPGPAVATTELYATAVGTAVMPSLPGPVQLRVGRLTGDANANALDILLAVVTFEEVA